MMKYALETSDNHACGEWLIFDVKKWYSGWKNGSNIVAMSVTRKSNPTRMQKIEIETFSEQKYQKVTKKLNFLLIL